MSISSGKELSAKIKTDMSRILASSPRAIGRIAINFMEDNFEKGGFQKSENELEKWEPRKRDDGSGRGILIGKQSGRLMKSGTIFRADHKAVVVGVPDNIAEYGKAHNEGANVEPAVTDKMRKFAWFKYRYSDGKGENWKPAGKDKFWMHLALTKKKKLKIKLPKRQFLGNSGELNRRIRVFLHDAFTSKLKGNITVK